VGWGCWEKWVSRKIPLSPRHADEFANMTDAELRTFVIEESRSLGLHVPSTNGRGNGW
jgi:hypothetical protein